MVLKEVAVAPGIGEVISVRSAKAHLSALLDLVASGHEITITSNGKPKAKLVKAEADKPGKVFQGMGDYLLSSRFIGGCLPMKPLAKTVMRGAGDVSRFGHHCEVACA